MNQPGDKAAIGSGRLDMDSIVSGGHRCTHLIGCQRALTVTDEPNTSRHGVKGIFTVVPDC
jgi:hypothetical protein